MVDHGGRRILLAGPGLLAMISRILSVPRKTAMVVLWRLNAVSSSFLQGGPGRPGDYERLGDALQGELGLERGRRGEEGGDARHDLHLHTLASSRGFICSIIAP